MIELYGGGNRRGGQSRGALAQTEYESWWHCGAENGGFFPVVDFQKNLDVISLKTIDSSTKTRDQKKNKICDPEIEIVPTEMSEDGRRRIHHYLDEKGKNVSKSKAVSVMIYLYASDGKFERVENKKL